MLRRKHIDAAHEVRMWIVQVIIPLVGITLAIPENRDYIRQKVSDMKRRIKK